MKRINHQDAYSLDGACTNLAESYFSRLRRAELGHHHHIAGPYLLRYAQEASWREDARRVDNGAQVRRVAELALNPASLVRHAQVAGQGQGVLAFDLIHKDRASRIVVDSGNCMDFSYPWPCARV